MTSWPSNWETSIFFFIIIPLLGLPLCIVQADGSIPLSSVQPFLPDSEVDYFVLVLQSKEKYINNTEGRR